MARYLLSSRTVLDIIQRKGRAGELWLSAAVGQRGLISRDVCISAVTPMAVRRELKRRIELLKGGAADPDFSLDDLLVMTRNAETFFRDYGGDKRVVAMTASIAERWGDLLEQSILFSDSDGSIYPIGSVQKLEIATAIVGRDDIPFAYVERAQKALVGINGLVLEDVGTTITASK